MRHDLRNIAIIAHVDHGKTTLVDGMLKQSNIFRDPDAAGELIMDVNDLERERGITILAKNASIRYGDVQINIVDTPGHADFGGEVERVLNMADGCLLLSTRSRDRCRRRARCWRRRWRWGCGRSWSSTRSIARRPARTRSCRARRISSSTSRPTRTSSTFRCSTRSRATDGPASSRMIWPPTSGPLMDTIIYEIPAPSGDPDAPFQMLVASLDYDPHRGRIVIGRVQRGRVHRVTRSPSSVPDGEAIEYRVSYLATFEGLGQRRSEVAEAGDIIALAGVSDARIGATLADPDAPEALPADGDRAADTRS